MTGRMAGAVALLLAALLAVSAVPGRAAPWRLLAYDDLLGWKSDDHGAALAAFRRSCMDIRRPGWKPLCAYAAEAPDARAFFETFFVPVLLNPEKPALFTGYYEPVLNGSLYRVGPYTVPIYRKPPDLKPGDPGLTRAAIDAGALRYKGLEIAYVDDPVGAYFMQVQGSGVIRLTNGNVIRLAYGGENGHPYRSAPRALIRKGLLAEENAGISGLRAWFRRDPERGMKALQENPSYVFFREIARMPAAAFDAEEGPLGALDRPLTAGRSLAVDPRFIPMGAPVWVEKGGRNPIRRLMVAQDTGGRIKGPNRADIFFGTGDEAGTLAGQTRDGGRMVVLLPVAVVLKLAESEMR